jgi:hypothetical protein
MFALRVPRLEAIAARPLRTYCLPLGTYWTADPVTCAALLALSSGSLCGPAKRGHRTSFGAHNGVWTCRRRCGQLP